MGGGLNFVMKTHVLVVLNSSKRCAIKSLMYVIGQDWSLLKTNKNCKELVTPGVELENFPCLVK